MDASVAELLPSGHKYLHNFFQRSVVRALGSVAAFGPTMSLALTEYISVAAVTAAYGSALTAGHFWKSAKSNQKRFAPTLGTSPRLGVP
ncbi:hypothetical protein J1G35_27345, partial [Pseudomonas sp. SH10-3B]|uniref:hypothetical protein n=1 Tax=Pseudomonas sp. SH10-3B TaxID=2816049 RepID=UPI001CA61618